MPSLTLSPCPTTSTMLNLYTCTLNIQSFSPCMNVTIDFGVSNVASHLIQEVCLKSKNQILFG